MRLLIKNATCVLPTGSAKTDVLIEDGKILAVGPPATARADEGFDAASAALLDTIVAVASGTATAAERNSEREIAIWKRGVTL